MTPEEIAEIERRHAVSTQGEWQLGFAGHAGVVAFNGEDIVYVCSAADHNKEFIAHAHEDIPNLIYALVAERTRAEKAEAALAASEAREKALAEALQSHHRWQLDIGTVIFPAQKSADENEDDQPEIELDLSAEYCDSALYQVTCSALAAYDAAHPELDNKEEVNA